MPSLLLQWTFDADTESWILQSGLTPSFSSTDGDPAGSIYRIFTGSNLTFNDRFQSPVIDWANLLPVTAEAITDIRLRASVKFVDIDGRLIDASNQLHVTIGGTEVSSAIQTHGSGAVPWTVMDQTIPVSLTSLGTGRMQVEFTGTISGGGGKSASPYVDTIEVEVFYLDLHKEGSVAISEHTNTSATGEVYIPYTADVTISEKPRIKTTSRVAYTELGEETVTKSWTFDNDAENWVTSSYGGSYYQYIESEGYPTAGAINGYGNAFVSWSTSTLFFTFEELGVPVGKTVTKIKATYYQTVTSISETVGLFEWYFEIEVDDVSTRKSWVTSVLLPYTLYEYTKIPEVPLESSQSIRLRHGMPAFINIDGSQEKNLGELIFDTVNLEITYASGTGDEVVKEDIAISSPANITATGTKPQTGDHYSSTVTVSEKVVTASTGTKQITFSTLISEVVNILKLAFKGIRYSIGISETNNISMTYTKTEQSYDFTGSVLISVGYNEAIQGQKSIRAPTTVSETSDMTVTGNKNHESGVNLTEPSQLSVISKKGSQGATLLSLSENVLYGVVRGSNFDLALSNPAELGIWSYKSISTGISVSESQKITEQGRKGSRSVVGISEKVAINITYVTQLTGLDKVGSVAISVKYQESIQGQKSIRSPTEIMASETITVTTSKAISESVTISESVALTLISSNDTVVDFLGSVTISEGASITSDHLKWTGSGVIITAGSNITTDSLKGTGAGLTVSEGIDITTGSLKATGAGVNISEGISVTVTGGEPSGTVVIISEKVAVELIGIKATGTGVELSEPVNVDSTIAQDRGQGIDITTGTKTTGSGTKKAGTSVTISEGATFEISYKLPYVLLTIDVSHRERQYKITVMERAGLTGVTERSAVTSILEYPVTVGVIERKPKTEVILVALSKNTVKLTAEFRGFDGELKSPDNVVLRIFKWDRTKIGEDIAVLPTSEGLFEQEYVLPDSPDESLYFEFEGTINGSPVIARDKIVIEYV